MLYVYVVDEPYVSLRTIMLSVLYLRLASSMIGSRPWAKIGQHYLQRGRIRMAGSEVHGQGLTRDSEKVISGSVERGRDIPVRCKGLEGVSPSLHSLVSIVR